MKQNTSTTTRKEVSQANTIKKGIIAAGGVKGKNGNSLYTLGKYHINFNKGTTVTVFDGDNQLFTSDYMQATKERAALIGIIKAAHSKQVNNGQSTEKEENTVMEKKPTKSVSRIIITEALKRASWSQDRTGVLTHSSGHTHVLFNPKTVRITNGDISLNVPTATTTDKQLIAYLQSMVKGEKPKMVKTPDLIPSSDPEFVIEPDPTQVSAKDKKEAAKIEKAKEAAKQAKLAKPPVNPAGKKTPVFDTLNNAITETDKTERALAGVWQPIAKQFKYSIVELSKALHSEGKWPNKLDKNGTPISVDGIFVPAGYKLVYNAERESGINGPGYMVNRASRMFARFNPDLVAGREKAKEAAKQAKPSKSTKKEQSTDDILLAMSKLAKQLDPEDLRSWLETDASVSPLWSEMAKRDGSIIDSIDLSSETEVDDDDDDVSSLVPETSELNFDDMISGL